MIYFSILPFIYFISELILHLFTDSSYIIDNFIYRKFINFISELTSHLLFFWEKKSMSLMTFKMIIFSFPWLGKMFEVLKKITSETKDVNFWVVNSFLYLLRFIRNDDDDDESFCGVVDQRKAFSLISIRDHWHDTPRAVCEPAQNLSSGLVEWSCAVVITTTPGRYARVY